MPEFLVVFDMVFSSLTFLFVFFTLTMIIYHAFKDIKAKNIVLLVASIAFYAWGEPKYVFLMIGVSFLDWIAGIFIEIFRKKTAGKIIFIFTVTLNLLSLVIFKYLNLFTGTLSTFTSVSATNIPLPIGISFYTFQAITYVADVYNGKVESQSNPFKLLLYISMFPQLIAGPIVRYSDIEAQINSRRVSFTAFSNGITTFVIGLGKKVILANFLGEITEFYFSGNTDSYTVIGTWMGLFSYFFQIYFDFSGYSDMAIGMGRMLGFTFNENFNYPYTAISVTDFWRRWHISLSTFFRDYVYIPLGGNRKNQMFNMFVVWTLTGFWHGASWNFLLWGLYYFLILALEKYKLGKRLAGMPRAVQHIYTIFVVLIGWIFFYFEKVSDIFKTMGRLIGIGCSGFLSETDSLYFKNHIILLIFAVIACTPLMKKFVEYCNAQTKKNIGGVIVFESATVIFQIGLFIICIACLVGSSYNPFLYFRF